MPVPDSSTASPPVPDASAGGRRPAEVHTIVASTEKVGQHASNVVVALDRKESIDEAGGEVENSSSPLDKVYSMVERARSSMMACVLPLR